MLWFVQFWFIYITRNGIKKNFYQKLWKILRVGQKLAGLGLFGLWIERFDWRSYRPQRIESWRQRAGPEYARICHIGTGFSWIGVRCSRRLSQTWRLRCGRCWTCCFVFDGILHPESGAARSSAIAANDGWFDVWFGLNRKRSNGYCGTWIGQVLVALESQFTRVWIEKLTCFWAKWRI